MKGYKSFLLLAFFFMLVLCTKGQQLHLKHFTVDDGLPSNEVYQVLQDTLGNLLIATDRGGVRFDGYSFKDILLENQSTSKPVYYIYKSKKGGVFFSSLQGLIYRYRKDTLFGYAYNDRTAKIFNHPGILIANSISAHKDTIWISFNNDYNHNYKVGSCFITKDGTVKKIDKPDGIYFDLNRNFFYRQQSQSGYSVTKQPVFISWENGTETKDEIDLNWRGGYIRRLFYLKSGEYDLFSIGRQLFIYKNQKKVGSYLFPEHVLSVSIAGKDLLYVGYENKGAGLYQLREGNIVGPLEEYLQGYSVTSVYKDKQGGLWLSTLEDGLFYNHPSQTRYWENKHKIVCINKQKDKVFIGYYSGLIQAFSAGRLVEEMQLPATEGTNLIRFSFDEKDSLISITNKGYFTWENGKWKFRQGQDILLLSAGNDLLYGASASTAELHVYKGPDRQMTDKKQLSKRIISMFASSPQELWVGTWEGLLKYENGRLTDYGSKSDVFKDRIVSINELSNKQLVVASLGHGIAVIKNNKVYRLNVTNGLRSPIINSVVIDKDNIWIGTNKGLTMARFENDSFRVVHMGLEAGLPSLDIHQFSVNNGWLYVKWVNRLVVLNTNDLLKVDANKRTNITSVMVNDKEGTYAANNNLLYKQNALTFHFTSINLAAALQQEYAYFLEGFDKSWHRTKERYVKYTNLPPGKYTFKVQAIDLKDNTPSALSTYFFTITPAFWQQWWFPFLCVSLIVILLLFLFQRRLNAIKEKNTLLLELAENRQKVLVQLIHPHFVFNVMNTIQGAILKQDKMIAASLIAKFAKLMRLSMELSKEKWVNLEKEIDLLTKYFELEEIRSPGRFAYEIEVAHPLLPSMIMIPSMLIQPFIENAIKHGVMHLAERKGYIHIRLWQENDEIICTIDDNGIGRQESERINQSKRDHQSSGIDITINRLRLLHREQNTPFLYEVIDKKNELGGPGGTTIKFSIPYKKSL